MKTEILLLLIGLTYATNTYFIVNSVDSSLRRFDVYSRIIECGNRGYNSIINQCILLVSPNDCSGNYEDLKKVCPTILDIWSISSYDIIENYTIHVRKND